MKIKILKLAAILFIILSIISAIKGNNVNFLVTSILYITSLGYLIKTK